jgi:hypothetical protein
MKNLVKILRDSRGIAMIAIIPIILMIALLSTLAIMTSNSNVETSGSAKRNSQAFYVAEAGLERATSEYVWGNFYDENVSPIMNPFGWLDALGDSMFYTDVPLADNGSYSVRVTSVVNPGPQSPYIDCRDVTIESTGKVPGGNESVTLRAVMRFGILPSDCFQYAYFINHFGWWAGFSSGNAVANGNVRANGHFDVLSGYFTDNGCPRVNPITGQVIDNGGVYAGGYVFPTSGSAYLGMASDALNRHSYAGVDVSENDRAIVEMPNLNDPADLDNDGVVAELNPFYIGLANGAYGNPVGRVGIDDNGDGILQPSEVVVTGAYGDAIGETGNVALVGTNANPIIVEGTVAVTGNLAIRGTIQGHGSFYVGRNTYVGGQITYKNALTARPVYNYGSESPETYNSRLDQWRRDNAHADMVAFLTVNNVISGDHTSSAWRSYILNGGGGWLGDYRNNGSEDVGTDGVFGNLQDRNNPYSASAREADGYFSVVIADEHGNQHLADLPVSSGAAEVPNGYHIVPGTGEDVDGDGQYDNPYNYSTDIDFNSAFNSTNYHNLSPSITQYSEFSDFSVPKLDPIFYTNHAFAGWFNDNATFNGSVIARNESIIVNGSRVFMNHDSRLSQNYRDLMNMNIYLPVIKRYSTVSWVDTGVR